MTNGIITLTTDFGTRDYYAGATKAAVLAINPNARLVDISHEIPPGDVRYGAYMIAQTCPYFPSGTVHLVVVDPGVGGNRRPIALQSDAGTFVGPDNGIFTSLFENYRVDMVVEIKEKRYYHEEVSPTFHGRDIFAPVSAHLSLGSIDLRDLGSPVEDPVMLERNEPAAGKDVIHGSIIRCDRFGNIITNVSGGLLMEFLGESEIAVEIGGNIIDRLEETYSSIETGQLLALIGSSGSLEVSVNGGDAGERLGVKAGDAVVIRRGGK